MRKRHSVGIAKEKSRESSLAVIKNTMGLGKRETANALVG